MNSSPRFPDFFVVGAPRCGTTSLCRYLARNPQICFSRPKEPHYFSRLDHIPGPDELNQDYLQPNFGHFDPSNRAIGEGSVSYLYLPGTIERINHINPQARFIVLVRNPLEMLPSYHLRMRFLLQEDEPDFQKAWELEAARARGERIPKHCLDRRLLFYSQAAAYGVQIERLFRVAGRERSHVMVFDDRKLDPLGEYRRVLDFLGVDYDGQTEFESRYESQMFRYRWLQSLLFIPATSGGKTAKTLQQRSRRYNPDGSKRKGLIKRLTGLNKVPMRPERLTPQMVDTVRETLHDDLAHLSRLLDRDLSSWFDKP